MVSAYYAALVDPLRLGFGLHIPERALSLLLREKNASRELRRQPVLAWSLHRDLQHLTFDGVPLEENQLLQRATFLFAQATGYNWLI